MPKQKSGPVITAGCKPVEEWGVTGHCKWARHDKCKWGRPNPSSGYMCPCPCHDPDDVYVEAAIAFADEGLAELDKRGVVGARDLPDARLMRILRDCNDLGLSAMDAALSLIDEAWAWHQERD
jgi:hypothetical protein